MKPETLAIHAGGEPDPQTGAMAPPLHLATTYKHGPAGERIAGYEYIRDTSPTQDRFEEALAAVEGGAGALSFASGMAAASALLHSLPAGCHMLIPADLYHGVRTLVQEFLPGQRVVATAVDMSDLAAVRAALRPDTCCVWVETPSNPLLEVTDVRAIAELLRAGNGALLAVDSTFASPALMNPLSLGAHVAMHSTTKYLGGHSDVMGGALVFGERNDFFGKVQHRRHVLGAVLSPFNAWLTLRGLRTLSCRMERHCRNARAVAEFLAGQPAVMRVNYPGLSSHPGHGVASAQMRDFGGMMSIHMRGGRDAALALAGRLKLITNATSLGGVESLVEHRASVEGANPVSPPELLRFSIGLEHHEDLIADLEQALRGI